MKNNERKDHYGNPIKVEHEFEYSLSKDRKFHKRQESSGWLVILGSTAIALTIFFIFIREIILPYIIQFLNR